MKYNDNGIYKDIYVKTFDTLPVGAIVEYSGSTIPSGWTDIGNDKIQKTSQYIEGGLSISDIYPIGSIYMSINNTNPSILFGGTWEQIQDRFLLGAGTTYTAGNTGGEATHTLTVDEMPSHNHKLLSNTPQGTSDVISTLSVYSGSDNNASLKISSSVGGSQAHNNMPPYLTVYMWKRTA